MADICKLETLLNPVAGGRKALQPDASTKHAADLALARFTGIAVAQSSMLAKQIKDFKTLKFIEIHWQSFRSEEKRRLTREFYD
jgi:hypothetical protein